MDQIEEVRSKIDIVQLIFEYLPLQKSGRNFKALCPFHAEKSPSFMVSPERQIFKCFGCQKGGSVFNFLMEMEGMEFGEALRTLAKRAGVKLAAYRPSTFEAERERLYEINHLAQEFYHYLLVSHSVGRRALNYLLGRGIKQESIKRFSLGYAPSLWEGLQKFLVGKRGYKADELLRLGLISRQASGFRDFFRDRIIFPLKDHRGNIVGFAARVIGSWQEEEAGKLGPKYLNTPETLLYHKSEILYGLELTRNAIKKQNQAVVVEGELDLISSFQTGVENVVAIKGSALTEAQCRLLKRFCENLILALDTDIAGDQAARRGIKVADSLGFLLKVAKVPEGKDPDELAQKNPELWRKTIKEAIGVYDFFLDSAFSRYDVSQVEGKKKIGEELIPLLTEIENEIVKNHYLRLLANRLGVGEEAVSAQVGKLKPTVPFKGGPQPEKKTSLMKSRREILEEYLLALFFQSRQETALLETEIKKNLVSPAMKRIIGYLETFLQKKKKFSSEGFAKILPSELLEIFNSFYLTDFGVRLEDKKWLEKEKGKGLQELEEVNLREQTKALGLEISRLEKEGKEKELEEVKKRFLRLSHQLGKVAQ